MIKEVVEMYQKMTKVFSAHGNEGLYDVDMFVCDVTQELFTETDPQDIDEDDYLIFQEALILLVRDDLLMNYYGTEGLSIIHADLMDHGEYHYINKVLYQVV